MESHNYTSEDKLMLEIKGLKKRFGGLEAVSNLGKLLFLT